MPLLVYGVGFAVCYFLFEFSWWMSLLIALAFPAALGIVMYVIGMPIAGISVLVDKIKERRQKTHLETSWEGAYGVVEEQEVPMVAKAEYFIMDLLDEGLSRRSEFNKQGKAMGYSEATIGRALNNLVEAGEIKRISRGVYSKVGNLRGESYIVEQAAKASMGEVQAKASILVEVGKERKRQSNTFGIWSLVTGITGLFSPLVGTFMFFSVAAIVLGILQFRRHATRCSIAGFTLGIVVVVLSLLMIALVAWLGYEAPYAMPL